MRRVTIPVLAALLAAAALAGRPAPAAAQQDYPVAVDPADCAGEPRDADEVLALWYGPDGSPIAAQADEEEPPTEVTIPLGEPADEETTAAIEETVVAVFACFAAGDFLAGTAYLTDDLLASFGAELGETTEAEARAFIENPEPEEGGRILAITDVMDLGDGRVGAFVVEQSEGGPPLSSYAIFVEGEDGWLVDEIVEFTTPAFEEGEEGTPAP